MVGETRDGETASMAVEASLTGHFVLSTIHTNDAASAPNRLIDMGIQPFLIASSLVPMAKWANSQNECIERTFRIDGKNMQGLSSKVWSCNGGGK